jgi:hypothetical protein
MAVSRSGIAKQLIRSRTEDAKNFAQMTEGHSPECEVLVAEAAQQRGQVGRSLLCRGPDLQCALQTGIHDIKGAVMELPDDVYGWRSSAGHHVQLMEIFSIDAT